MEVTFMTMNDLTEKCRIIFATDSVQDILGYTPEEAQHRSAFDFIHPAELETARRVYSRAILLDKASVLHTLHLLDKNGNYVKCECSFTVVKDVLVSRIGLYEHTPKSERRAHDAPRIRQLFKCSAKDPMYHMLEQLSPKYKMPPTVREPRAFLILNRFTRTLTILFATESVFDIIGLTADEITNESFYKFIHPSCLSESIGCLENAKANDSLAYLRFLYYHPRMDDDQNFQEDSYDEYSYDDNDCHDYEYDDYRYHDYTNETHGIRRSIEDTIPMQSRNDSSSNAAPIKSESSPSPKRRRLQNTAWRSATSYPPSSAINPSSAIPEVLGAMEAEGESSWLSRPARRRRSSPRQLHSIEVEAVISCTSDGVGVVIRRARPPIPTAQPLRPPPPPGYSRDIAASPYGSDHRMSPLYDAPDNMYTFQPQLMPPEDSDLDPARDQYNRITR
ncbi:hypothetical protein BROUX41_004299 [Berkeleyomyces rouxiae]|uniref:uncharacterized protein n=1 Tax=Berkeleyomyces rouxiae TaxID=2035830 RepID=UPI003B7A2EAE